MSDVNLPPPFEAYSGKDAYIFVSYSHEDSTEVFHDLQWLHEQGYSIWYDEGINPGNEWPDEVAKALCSCSQFLVFITSNACSSRNVMNEINYAVDLKLPFIPVHMQKTDLPPGLALRIGSVQAILKYKMSDKEYRQKLLKVMPEHLIEIITDKELKKVIKDTKGLHWKDDHAAIEIYKGLMKRIPHPKKAEMYRNISGSYLRLQMFDRAIEMDREALKLNPNYLSSHVAILVAYRCKGQLHSALRVFDEIKRRKLPWEEHKELLVYLAEVMIKLGKREDGKKYLEMLKLNNWYPDSPYMQNLVTTQ